MSIAMFFSSPVFPAFAPPKLLRLRPFSSSFSSKQLLSPAAPLAPIITQKKKKVGPLPVTMGLNYALPEVIETEYAIVVQISLPGVVSLNDVEYKIVNDKLLIRAQSSAFEYDYRGSPLGYPTYFTMVELNGANRFCAKLMVVVLDDKKVLTLRLPKKVLE